MKFQSKWNKMRYVLKRSSKTITEYGPVIKWGLVAKFHGPQRIFDSDLAAEEFGWTAKEKAYVEDRLLKHKDFGVGLYLAPGEEMTPEIAAKIDPRILEQKSRGKQCQEIWTENYEVKQCKNPVSVGRDFCDEHAKDVTKVVKGVMTTKT